MKNLIGIRLYFIYFSLTLTSCAYNTLDHLNVYESCCGTEPVEFNIQSEDSIPITAYLYVPNAFTPNGDSINDLFMPIMNAEIIYINYFVIEQEVQNDTVSSLLYSIEEVLPNDMALNAWNGIDKIGNPYKGPFIYTISISTVQGLSYEIKGRGCAIVCDPDAKIFQNKEGCFYSTQANSQGILDIMIVNGESTCFGL